MNLALPEMRVFPAVARRRQAAAELVLHDLPPIEAPAMMFRLRAAMRGEVLRLRHAPDVAVHAEAVRLHHAFVGGHAGRLLAWRRAHARHEERALAGDELLDGGEF